MEVRCMFSPEQIIEEFLSRYPKLVVCESMIIEAYELLVISYQQGGKLLICGNGGSAADSEHAVGELMKSFRFKRAVDPGFLSVYRDINGCDAPEWLEGSLPAISLISQTALSTAFGNDESAVGVFAQQILGYGKVGDVLMGISTSGSSLNVIEAAKVARAKHMKIIALTGEKKSELSGLADVAISVPENETFKVQEYHLPVYHCLCAMVEAKIFGGFE